MTSPWDLMNARSQPHRARGSNSRQGRLNARQPACILTSTRQEGRDRHKRQKNSSEANEENSYPYHAYSNLLTSHPAPGCIDFKSYQYNASGRKKKLQQALSKANAIVCLSNFSGTASGDFFQRCERKHLPRIRRSIPGATTKNPPVLKRRRRQTLTITHPHSERV